MRVAIMIPWLIAVFITQLGSPKFRERERAHIALTHLLPHSETALRKSLTSQDIETRVRADSIIKQWWTDTAEAKADNILPTGYKLLPWIDQLPKAYPKREEITQQYLIAAQHKIGRKGPPLWEDYRLGTKLFIRKLFGDGADKRDVQKLLDQMRDSEIEWFESWNGKNYKPRLVIPWK